MDKMLSMFAVGYCSGIATIHFFRGDIILGVICLILAAVNIPFVLRARNNV